VQVIAYNHMTFHSFATSLPEESSSHPGVLKKITKN